MRSGSSGRRSRSRGNNNNKRNQNHRSQVFDSNGPEVRIRGTAHQVQEKYMGLAKDAASSGDHVLAESYLQHAEHYQRIISSWDEQDEVQAEKQQQQQQQQQQSSSDDDLGLPSSMLQPSGREEELETA